MGQGAHAWDSLNGIWHYAHLFLCSIVQPGTGRVRSLAVRKGCWDRTRHERAALGQDKAFSPEKGTWTLSRLRKGYTVTGRERFQL